MRQSVRTIVVWAGTAALVAASAGEGRASLARGAAGAKNIGEAGRLVVDTATEFEHDQDGHRWTGETGLQYQLTRRLQTLVEATVLEADRPKSGERATGFGDTDVTLSWLVAEPRGVRPSVVLGGKVKLPTAGHAALGTRKADYSALLVLGRETGELELEFQAEYVTYGQPGGPRLRDQWLYTLTAEYALNDLLAVYGEVAGASAPTAADSRTDAALGGVELDLPITERVAPYLSFELSTEAVGMVRAGIEWSW